MTREIDGKGYVSFSSIEGIAEVMCSETILGLAAFGKVNDRMFRRVVLSALLVSGVGLL